MHIFLLNGPPKCGKDTLAQYFHNNADNCYRYSFAQHLKDVACHILVTTPEQIEKHKDDVDWYDFKNSEVRTIRQFLINLSENFCKSHLGDEYFGEVLAMKLAKDYVIYGMPIVLISDSGFKEEAQILRARLPDAEFTVVHISRPGCTFMGDSRDYINLEGVETVSIENNGSLTEFIYKMRRIMTTRGLELNELVDE